MEAITTVSGDNLSAYNLSLRYLPRPRIGSLFEQAAKCKLVYVIAGAGYGKTQAVRHFIEQQQDAVVRWIQLTESDNVGFRYWENLTHNVSYDNPDLAVKLRELGFPDTPARFKRFAEILKSAEHRSHKTFLVLDDFHVIHSEQALTFAERCAYLHIPGACVIIISRNEPEINAVPLFSKGQVSIITEEELCFTESEISDFMKYREAPVTPKILPRFFDATKGWALAVLLLSMVLKRAPGNPDLALETMKQNIFKLMEVEAFNDFPEDTRKIMVRLSLVSNLPLTVLQELFSDISFIKSAPQLASFVWFDSFTGEGRVHPLYWEFLQSKRHILSGEETDETYRRAAQWCVEAGFFSDAMNYYAKSRQYKKMLETLLSYPFKLPRDSCEYLLGLLESLDPDNEEPDDHNLLLLKIKFIPLLLMGIGKYDDARNRISAVIREWEHSEKEFSANILYTAYSNLAYIDIYNCTVTHKYTFLDNLKKSVEYYKSITIPPLEITGPFAVADIRSLACLVGENAELSEFDLFLETVRKTALYISETSHNMYYGYDDLVACELAFYMNKPDLAKKYAFKAIIKAREKKQYSIEAMASQYLLRVATQEGKYQLANELLKQFRGYLGNADFWNRQLLYDLFTGFFYAQIGLPGSAPSWLLADDAEEAPGAAQDVRIPVGELMVSANCYIAYRRYDQAYTVLCNAYPREPHERFLLSELTFLLLTAVVKINTGDAPGAIKDFENAYSLSFNGVFEMPFIERGKHLQPLIAAAKQARCGVPDKWLGSIGRKASIYAKKTDAIMNMYKKEKNIDDIIKLSDREQAVLVDLYHGLSREEIASNQYLSVNTVKKTLQSIYIKLDASNNVDAVRIAIEQKLIS